MRNQLEEDIMNEPEDPLDESGIRHTFLENYESKPHAHIEDWWYDGQRLWGRVSKHPEQESFKAECQATSFAEIDLENGFAETENTIYKLGTPRYLTKNLES